ncbi:MAG TPA: hypothetical protein VGQ73_05985, partial [Gemmatimonadales bacterium]|nr:hypothetical protein [Gemmatimonadales bacterium]
MRLRRLPLLALPWLAALALWYAIHASGIVNPALVPTPAQVFRQFLRMLRTQRLWMDMYMSSQRVVIGVVCGIALAVPVGFLLGWYRPVR